MRQRRVEAAHAPKEGRHFLRRSGRKEKKRGNERAFRKCKWIDHEKCCRKKQGRRREAREGNEDEGEVGSEGGGEEEGGRRGAGEGGGAAAVVYARL